AQRRLTSEKGDDENPAWSPDGKHIAFDSDRNYPDGESHELYSIRPDGSCLTWLTNGSASSGDPTWEPGIGLSSDPGSCGPVQRTPLTESQPPPRGPLNVPMYWLGPVGPGSLLLSLVQVDRHFAEIDYDD